jgi:1-acyl-sn-glycerol-3-phosphate acyltransferase
MTSRVNRRPFLVARRLLKLLLALPMRALTGFTVVGAERLPRDRRPLILACNHAALVDTVFMALAVRPRFTVCGAKPRYFRSAVLRTVMAVANILPVDGKESFLEDCHRLLVAGETLLIYPEMGRNPDGLGEFSTWVAEVALRDRVPILPCHLHGTAPGQDDRPRLVVGTELTPRGGARELTERLRSAIASLGPDASGVEGLA